MGSPTNATQGSTTVHTAAITDNDPNTSPTITSNGGGGTASINVAENTTAVTTVAATDSDAPAQTLTFSIVGRADAGKLQIGASSGVLVFASAPDFEDPQDSGGNNVYDVTVQVTDSFNGTDTQDIAVTVTDAAVGAFAFSSTAYSDQEGDSGTHTVTITVTR